jgi:anti-sigma regulatory factor (Ser/Thr protein kinase)
VSGGYRLRLVGRQPVSRDVARFVAALADDAGLTARQSYRLRLAADELATNVVEHGYLGGIGTLDLEAGIRPDLVWLRIQDDAPPFDPVAYAREARPTDDPGSLRAGGCGLLLVRHSVDAFHYDYVAGRNRSTFCVRRSDTGSEPDRLMEAPHYQPDRTCDHGLGRPT